MGTPLEDVVGNNYKALVRFFVAAGAIITVVLMSAERARAFVNEQVDNKVKTLDAQVTSQSTKIERMDQRLGSVHDDVTEIKAQVGAIKLMLEHKEK